MSKKRSGSGLCPEYNKTRCQMGDLGRVGWHIGTGLGGRAADAET